MKEELEKLNKTLEDLKNNIGGDCCFVPLSKSIERIANNSDKQINLLDEISEKLDEIKDYIYNK